MKRIAILALALLLAVSAAAEGVCNWYEVFVRSYQDSDGDGIGDLNGLRARLDYIEDMGWRGLWLMPVMPSPSYHKYDVTDYCAVDPEYGTLDDIRALAEDCRARGISVIVDLPVNHTSTQHPWFRAACEAIRAGDPENAAVGFYCFHSGQPAGNGFTALEGTDWTYEERFAGGGMPDLNLDSPAVLDGIRDVMDFWLNDVGVDGFRLDAVTSYFTGDTAKNVALLRWLKQTAESLKPGSFLVGECWANLSTIAEYYDSGVDSFFLFPAAQAEGFVAKSLLARKARAEKFASGWQKVLDAIPEGRLAPFLCNHDTGRTIGLVRGRSNPDIAKFAEGALGMLGGGVFTYYGEEVGMAGSGDDPNKRLAMPWSEGDMTAQPPGATTIEYPYPGVEAQQADPASLLNYVRAVNHARLENPLIADGENETLLSEGDLLVMRRSKDGESLLVAMNFSPTQALTLPVAARAIRFDLETGDATAALEETADGRTLTLPPYAIVGLSE